MKKTLFLIWTLLLSVAVFAQSNSFYYYKGEKKPLTLDKSKVNIFTTNEFDASTVANIVSKDFVLKKQNATGEKWATVDLGSQLSDEEFYQKMNSLRNNPQVNSIGYCYKDKKGKSVGTSNQFFIKLKGPEDLPLLQQQAKLKNVKITKPLDFDTTWYGLITTRNTAYTAIEIANQFIETGLFEEMDAAFILHFIIDDTLSETSNSNSSTTSGCVNDAEFNLQWGLNNTTNPNIDINACEAWAIPGATGSSAKVGVIDTGILLNHADLAANIYPESYDSNTQTQPSQLTDHSLYFHSVPPHPPYTGNELIPYKHNHGTHVAGIIGAVSNTSDISGIAPQCKIIAVSNYLNNGDLADPTLLSLTLAYGIDWAREKGADIINCSWRCENDGFNATVLESRIIFAINNGRNGKGCIVVFVSGNYYMLDGESPTTSYPSYIDPRIMVVGAINSTGFRAPLSAYEVDSSLGLPIDSNIDVVAPGVDIRSLVANIIQTVPDPATGLYEIVDQRTMSGTSMAAPHISGTAALMLSVNPCLSGQQVRDIIEQTAQKLPNYVYTSTPERPNGTWNNETGYGLIDAYAAVQMAKSLYTSSLDLMVKDSSTDLGIEPNTTTQYMWTSDAIWVRNNDDGTINQVHENPEYTPSVPNYVYVRVTNKSCTTSSGNEKLKLFWAKASTGLGWPNPWNGGIYENGSTTALMGEPLGEKLIPALQPGQEAIVKFSWEVPNPNNYSQEQWHFCLLTKIETSDDPLTFDETSDLNLNVKNNNNIAWKNISVFDAVPDAPSFTNTINNEITVAVCNPLNNHHSFYLEIVKEDLETGKDIYDEAEVSIKMNDVLYNAWERGGKEAQMVEATPDEKNKIVKGNHVLLDNILFNPNESGTLTLKFNFLTKELTDKNKFVYHVIQKDAETGAIVGGETYIIRKKARPIFEAIADDQEKDRNETITISAQQISEPALYNWYDTDGNLVFTGKDLTIATQVAQKYKLEVIATADGFKDYTEVEVTLKPSALITIAPNPATDAATIGYKINEVGSAYLMVLGGYGTTATSNNYILNPDLSEININLADYSNGFYTVALVVNGKIVDAKTLIKQ